MCNKFFLFGRSGGKYATANTPTKKDREKRKQKPCAKNKNWKAH